MVNDDENEDSLRLDLALANEKRDIAAICLSHSKNKMAKYYNKRVHPISFKPGDHVMRINEVSKAAGQGKLALNWEGSYIIRQENDNGSYLLTRPEGVDIPPKEWESFKREKTHPLFWVLIIPIFKSMIAKFKIQTFYPNNI